MHELIAVPSESSVETEESKSLELKPSEPETSLPPLTGEEPSWQPRRFRPLARLASLSQRQLALILAVLLIGAWWFVPSVYKLRGGSVTVTRWDKKRGKTEVTIGPAEKGWVSTKKISRHTLNAILAAEDGKFYEHHGIDWESIWEAVETNWKKRRYVRGGSTLSQQVVKMAFLGREKTLLRKAREAVGTLLMELILPKEKILEWYINLAEFGDGVYGVAEGSWHYFKTKPELLTIEQAAHLALVLPSPNRWSSGLRRRALTPFGHRRYAAILNNMKMSGHITRTQWMTAVTRGDFGKPIRGYDQMLQAEAAQRILCPGSPGCPDMDEGPADDGEFDVDAEVLTSPTAPNPAPVDTAPPPKATETTVAPAPALPLPPSEAPTPAAPESGAAPASPPAEDF